MAKIKLHQKTRTRVKAKIYFWIPFWNINSHKDMESLVENNFVLILIFSEFQIQIQFEMTSYANMKGTTEQLKAQQHIAHIKIR